MPKLSLSEQPESVEVQENQSIMDAAEKLGVPFSCTEGTCGTCLTRVTKGIKNLSPLSEAEEEFGLEPDERLLCQAKIANGDVEIEL